MTGPTRRDALSGAAALAACLTASSARAATALAMPGQLTAEHAVGPIGLETPHPRLAWCPPVARQSAWRVQVAASEADLLAGRLTWDSGKVADTAAVEASLMAALPCPTGAPTGPARAAAMGRATGRPGALERARQFRRWVCWLPADRGDAAWIGRRPSPPRGWADQTLTIDYTLKGRFFASVLFRGAPREGKTYGRGLCPAGSGRGRRGKAVPDAAGPAISRRR
ncbi:hypothetical protein ACRAWD_30340 [Caulobacter segnis]